MLLQHLVRSRVDLSSNHGKRDVLIDWVPRKICPQNAEYSHESSNSYAIPESIGTCKRRKLNSLAIFPVEPDTANSEHDSEYKKYSRSITHSIHSQLLLARLRKDTSCSSLKDVDMKVGSAATTTEAGNTKESHNSELVDLAGGHLSQREICISVLTTHGLLVRDCPIASASTEVVEISNIFQYCDLCGILDNTLNMLLCDHCEGAFHLSCCNTKTKMLPIDEWFCHSCSNLDDKVSLEASFSFLKSQSIRWGNGPAIFKSDSITSMLKYPDSYISCVGIGDSFQAAVPQWSEQISKDIDCIGEPFEMDPLKTIDLHGSSIGKHLKPSSATNWLQCQEVLYDDAGECVEGTICGKWRRAPLSEVQTADWDCSCSVLWDPSHSDCAVPQELGTNEVLRQLKYIDQLRSRLATKKGMDF